MRESIWSPSGGFPEPKEVADLNNGTLASVGFHHEDRILPKEFCDLYATHAYFPNAFPARIEVPGV
jgi:hypothetical protein